MQILHSRRSDISKISMVVISAWGVGDGGVGGGGVDNTHQNPRYVRPLWRLPEKYKINKHRLVWGGGGVDNTHQNPRYVHVALVTPPWEI